MHRGRVMAPHEKHSGTLVRVCVRTHCSQNLLCADSYPVNLLWKPIWHASELEKYSLNKTSNTLHTILNCVKSGLTPNEVIPFSLLFFSRGTALEQKAEHIRTELFLFLMSLNPFILSWISLLHQLQVLEIKHAVGKSPYSKTQRWHLMTKA